MTIYLHNFLSILYVEITCKNINSVSGRRVKVYVNFNMDYIFFLLRKDIENQKKKVKKLIDIYCMCQRKKRLFCICKTFL